MGCCASIEDEQFGYEDELLRQKDLRSVEFAPPDEKLGVGAVVRCRYLPDFLKTPLPTEVNSIWNNFDNAAKKFGDRPCLGVRMHLADGARGEFIFINYKQAQQDVIDFGRGLIALGLLQDANVGIFSVNRPEWTITSLACGSQCLRTVALYDSLGSEAVKFIINHADISTVVVSKDKLPQLLAVADDCKSLRYVIQFDNDPRFGQQNENLDQKDVAAMEDRGITLLSFSDVKTKGKQPNLVSNKPAGPDDLAFIMYTSGTTGTPKGVMLTHGGCVSSAYSIMQLNEHTPVKCDINGDDVYFSYLPLAHIFETQMHIMIFYNGASIGFFQGSAKKLMDDLAVLKPTVLCGVPRVFQKMYEGFLQKVQNRPAYARNAVMRKLAEQAKRVRIGQPVDNDIDQFFRQNVRTGLGLDRCKIIITGAAPMPPYIMEFLKVVVNPKSGVLQGYGLTETSAACSLTEIDDHTMGHVGPPVPCVEVRLKDVPDMNYFHTDTHPRGEVQIRGPPVFKGYYQNAEVTREVIGDDGWFSTGDIGRWNPDGTLSIIDRKKNIFKLAQGEYVAVEKIEAAYLKSPLVTQVFVYGNSYKSSVVAVVVPDLVPVVDYATKQGWWLLQERNPGNAEVRKAFRELVQARNKELTEVIMASLVEQGKKHKLLPYEIVKAIYLEGEVDETGQGFNVANDLLTPTFKLRRPFLVKRYMEQLVQMYTAIGEPPKPDEKW